MGYLSRDQFETIRKLGKGAYGEVFLVRRTETGVKYALKVVEKSHILRYNKTEAIFRERDIGSELSGHRNIVEFVGTFQDEDHLYFLLEYVENGSLA